MTLASSLAFSQISLWSIKIIKNCFLTAATVRVSPVVEWLMLLHQWFPNVLINKTIVINENTELLLKPCSDSALSPGCDVGRSSFTVSSLLRPVQK